MNVDQVRLGGWVGWVGGALEAHVLLLEERREAAIGSQRLLGFLVLPLQAWCKSKN
jgi:hypothetical protein